MRNSGAIYIEIIAYIWIGDKLVQFAIDRGQAQS